MSSLKGALSEAMKENKKLEEKQEYQPKGSQIDPEGLHDYMKEEIDKLKEVESLLQPFQNTETFHMKVEEMIKENKLIKDEAKMFGKAFKKIDEENKKLKEEVVTFPEKLKLVRANASLEFVVKLNEAVADLQILAEKAEIKKLKEENKKLEKDLIQQKKIAFWRMAEAYAGYDKNTCIHDEDWCNEVKESMEEYYGSDGEELGSIDELLEGYKDWIGVVPWE